MRRIFLSLLFVVALIGFALALVSNPVSADRSFSSSRQNGKSSTDGLWVEVDSASLQRSAAVREIIPLAFRTFRLNKVRLQSLLRQAPMEFTDAARNTEVVLTIPMPDGKLARFRIVESPIMELELAAKFPEIKTYSGQGIDDRTATLRFDLTPFGFHAQILSATEVVYVDPYAKGDTENYISYYKRALNKETSFICHTGSTLQPDKDIDVAETQLVVPPNGDTLRNYRMALAATGEYTAAAGGTEPMALARMTTSINRVNGIYERELAVRLTLIANTNLLIYTNAATDPYTNDNGDAMLTENQTNVDMVIGNANYDIGHVFSTGGGGIATSPCVCNNAQKAQGVTGSPNPVGDAFDVDFVAHEVGHQFGGSHTFNTTTGAMTCDGNRETDSAYEPGSGSTIIAYAGICAPNNLQPNSNDYFHIRTLNQAVAHITGAGNCAANTATGNTPPTVNPGANFTIPRNTPFALTAAGADINGDALTYCWEEFDLGPQAPPEGDADGMARPLFRSYNPTANPTRTFPSLQYILNNANIPPATYDCAGQNCITGESLPNITRTMNFQVTVRDNRAGGGGIISGAMQVSVNAGSGPFNVTSPNTAVNYNGNSLQTVTWNVANTTAAPVSAANVKISLSTDGGTTFPTVILASTANDGTEQVTIPNSGTTTARIKVEAVGNIFFDISDTNFTITAVAGGNNKPADFDGDGKTDVSVFRPSNGGWYLLRSQLGFTGVTFGTNGDRPVPGDYDGDGKTDIAVYRPANGGWYRLNSSNGAFVGVFFGAAGDIPVPGRYDNDNKTDVAVFRPGNGTWYVLRSTDGGLTAQGFGTNGDIPVSGDYDGDGRTDFSVFRPTTGSWYIQQTTAGFLGFQFGTNGDAPVPGDFDGDGKTDIAVYRPTTGGWYVQRSQLGFFAVAWGAVGDQTAAGDYDGDNKTDVGVFRPSTGTFYILQSTNGALRAEPFGTNGDLSVPGAYAP